MLNKLLQLPKSNFPSFPRSLIILKMRDKGKTRDQYYDKCCRLSLNPVMFL